MLMEQTKGVAMYEGTIFLVITLYVIFTFYGHRTIPLFLSLCLLISSLSGYFILSGRINWHNMMAEKYHEDFAMPVEELQLTVNLSLLGAMVGAFAILWTIKIIVFTKKS